MYVLFFMMTLAPSLTDSPTSFPPDLLTDPTSHLQITAAPSPVLAGVRATDVLGIHSDGSSMPINVE
jgi:hypothetical protein